MASLSGRILYEDEWIMKRACRDYSINYLELQTAVHFVLDEGLVCSGGAQQILGFDLVIIQRSSNAYDDKDQIATGGR